MKRVSRLTSIAVLLLAFGISGASAASAPDRIYLATLVDTSHVLPGAESIPIRVRLARLTADDRVADLASVAREKGALALRRALETESVGRLEINGHLGNPISYARRTEDASGVHLLLISERSLSLREIFGMRRSTDFPFTVVEIDLAPDGSGTGNFYGAARIRPRKGGELELDGLSPLPARLMAVKATS
jgi:hypothetical protein